MQSRWRDGMSKQFYGDVTRWFIGTVINHTPPPGKEGKVQIRIHGVHSPCTMNIPQAHLPWADILIPGTEEGVSGLGLSPKIMTGAQVFGIFLDGRESQYPIVLGSLNKKEDPSTNQIQRNSEESEFVYQVGTRDKFGYIDSQEELLAEFKNIRRDVTEIVTHWTETHNNKDLSAADIELMDSLPYHYVIRRDGTIQRGSPVGIETNHTNTAHDQRSIAVAFVGGLNVPTQTLNSVDYKSATSLTRSQINSYEFILRAFYRFYPGGQVIGFNDVDSTRVEPGFDVRKYCKNVFNKQSAFDDGLITRGPFNESEINQ
jgi:proteasome lid subunit RPN8/RPN11